MGIVKRQAIINSVIIYLGFGIGALNITYLFLKNFSAAELGTKETLIAFTLIIMPLGLIGANASILKFYPRLKHFSKHGLLGFFFFLLIIYMTVTFTSIYLFSDQIITSYQTNAPLFTSYFHLIYPLTFFFVSTSILESFSRSHFETYLPTFLREVVLRLLTTFLILGYSYKLYDFSTFLKLYTLSFGFSFIVLLIYLITRHNHSLIFRFKLIKHIPLQEIIAFSGFSFLTSAATILMLQVDKLMVSNIISDDATGIYALAIYLATLIEVPRRAIVQTISPLISQAWKTFDLPALKKSYIQASINQQLIGSLLFSLLWINIDNIYYILPNSDIYSNGKYVVLFIGGSKLIDMTFGVNGEIIGYSKHYKFNFYATLILALLVVLSNFTFIRHFGINGAAFATFLSILIFNIAKYIFIWNKFSFHAFNSNTIKLLIITTISIAFIYHLPSHTNLLLDIILKSIIFCVPYLISSYFFKVSPEYSQIINKLLNR